MKVKIYESRYQLEISLLRKFRKVDKSFSRGAAEILSKYNKMRIFTAFTDSYILITSLNFRP